MKMELQQHTNNQAAKVARTVAAKRQRPRGKITNILIPKKNHLLPLFAQSYTCWQCLQFAHGFFFGNTPRDYVAHGLLARE